MITSTLKFFIVDSFPTRYSDEQVILTEFTGKHFSRDEAEDIWRKVMNHKWNISENLRRDVGLKVAAIDFVENFYQPGEKLSSAEHSSPDSYKVFFKRMMCAYFEEKGKTINL